MEENLQHGHEPEGQAVNEGRLSQAELEEAIDEIVDELEDEVEDEISNMLRTLRRLCIALVIVILLGEDEQ